MNFIQAGVIFAQRVWKGLASRSRNLYYRLLGVRLHGYVWLQSIEIPHNTEDIEIESPCALDRGVVLLSAGEPLPHPRIQIGAHTYINRNTFLDAILSIAIGQHCAIGPGCYITDHDHGQDPTLPPLQQAMIAKPTKLGDRVWLGANVTVLKGVTIGNDTIVGAGSVVTKDLPQGAIAVGVPAKVIRYRSQNHE